MKAFRLIVAAIMLIVCIVVSSCKYDVAEPLWSKPYTAPATPKITQVVPNSALAGVNTIKIIGENFVGAGDTCLVYFDNYIADVISLSATSIVVRRPNIVKDTSTIKVVPRKALVEAKYKPFKVEGVLTKYGSFLDNLPLSVLAADASENIYVVETTSRNIYKVTPQGVKTIIGAANRTPYDARVYGPGNKLILTGNNRAIDQVDLATNTVSRWTQMPSGKSVRYGDFDDNGYFYTGGSRTDLCIIPPNPPASLTSSGIQLSNVYADDDILAVRFYKGYLYVASISTTAQAPVAKIWKHKISAGGALGSQELVYDMSKSAAYSARTIKAISFSSTGLLYLATDSPEPILVCDPANSTIDLFYKGILPSYCKHFNWGSGNYLYMITGDTGFAAEWTVYKVNIGATGSR